MNMKGGSRMENKGTIIVLIIAILLVGGYLFYSDLDKNAPSVTAQGSYSIKVQPDQASVYLNSEGRAKTLEEAKKIESEKTDKTLSALLALGIEKKDIQNINYYTYPEYDYSGGRSEQKGFVVSQQILVKVTDFDKVAGIVDKSVDSGVLVQSINFELSEDKQNQYKTEVITKAGEDAKVKAEAIAAGQGKELGRLVSVQPQDYYYPGPIAYYDKAVAESSGDGLSVQSAVANLAPQDLEIRSSILVQYKLK